MESKFWFLKQNFPYKANGYNFVHFSGLMISKEDSNSSLIYSLSWSGSLVSTAVFFLMSKCNVHPFLFGLDYIKPQNSWWKINNLQIENEKLKMKIVVTMVVTEEFLLFIPLNCWYKSVFLRFFSLRNNIKAISFSIHIVKSTRGIENWIDKAYFASLYVM